MSENALKWKIGTCHILGWLFVNVGLATSPILISYFFPLFTKNGMFSSILAYAFTFLIVGLYVFTVGRKFYSPERLQFWIFAAIAIGFGLAYVFLNYDFRMMKFIECHFRAFVILLFCIATISGLWLHWESLWQQIHQEVTDKQQELAATVKSNVQCMKGNIDQGGDGNG